MKSKNKKKFRNNKSRSNKVVDDAADALNIKVEEPSEVEIMPTAVPIESKKSEEPEINLKTEMPTVEPPKLEPIDAPPEAPPEVPPEVPEDIKHPLENTWGFWLYTNENRKDWAANQKELTSFDTVEDYWCLYHYMKQPSELKQGQDYAVFKLGISPMWEDEANISGGRWLVNVERRGEMDRFWLDVVLFMIGENFNNNDDICGAVVNVRAKQSRVSIWTRNKDESANVQIGMKLKELLRINYKLQFLDHNGSIIFHI